MDCGCNDHRSELQQLLDEHNRKSNSPETRHECPALKDKLKALRGDVPPPCWGEDDCSTMMLVQCPWSIDCG